MLRLSEPSSRLPVEFAALPVLGRLPMADLEQAWHPGRNLTAEGADQMATESQLENAVNRIEKRLDWIEENLGRLIGAEYVPMGRSDVRPDASGVPADVLELIRAGQKLAAIKRYRDLTGFDVAHAKQVIDDL